MKIDNDNELKNNALISKRFMNFTIIKNLNLNN